MKKFANRWIRALILLVLSLINVEGDDLKLDVEALPEWKRLYLQDVEFQVVCVQGKELGIGKIISNNIDWFAVISCTPKVILGKRLLWADVDIEFSDGSKYSLDRVQFNVIGLETGADIDKLPSGNYANNKIISIKFRNIAIK